jgi:4-amino-4-deoxy-L-arabinose transferase-like glycosyltransferase
VLVILYFYGLSDVGLLGPDEPRYASIGREMAQTGDWITPVLWGEPWFEKPALLYWLVGAGYLAGFSNEVAARLPVVLLSLAFLFLFFHRMRREFGSAAAFYASLILGTSAGWLVYSQVAVTDLPLAATFSAAVLFCLPWVRSSGRRGLNIGGLFLGFAVLAKGLVALVLILPVLWIGRARVKDLLAFGFLCFVVAAPWYFLCWYVNGSAFIDEFFWKHHFGRFVSAALQHTRPWWFYIPVLVGVLFPWSPLIVLLGTRDGWGDRRRVLLLLVVIWGFVFFSLSENKLPGYLLPLLPSLAALLGLRLAETKGAPLLLGTSALLLGVLPSLIEALPVAVGSGLSRANLALSVWSLLALPVAAAVWHLERTGRRRFALTLITTGVVAAIVAIKAIAYPQLDLLVSARKLWEKHRGEQNLCLASQEPTLGRSQRYGLNFYAGRAIPDCAASDAPPIW